jgi:hypothetical protein
MWVPFFYGLPPPDGGVFRSGDRTTPPILPLFMISVNIKTDYDNGVYTYVVDSEG